MNDTYYIKVLNRIIGYVAYSARTEHEVKVKIDKVLLKSSLSETDKPLLKQRIIEELHVMNLFDDVSYAKEFVRSRLSRTRPAGRNLIFKQLLTRGVSISIIKDALEYIDPEDEKVAMQKLFDRKHKQLEYKLDIKSKQKIIKYLIGRGCSLNLVYSLVDSKFKVK